MEIRRKKTTDATAILSEGELASSIMAFPPHFFCVCHYFAEKGTPPNPNGTVVIKNIKPSTWSGQKYDVGYWSLKVMCMYVIK